MVQSFSLAWLLALSLTASALPHHEKRQDDTDQSVKIDKFQWQIWKACPDEQRLPVVQAWKDSQRYADALKSWVPKGDYQAAMDMYMGDRSTFQSFGDPGFDYPKQIQDTARRARGLFDGKSEYGSAYLWVYCNEESFWFKHCKQDETSAIIAYEQEDNFFNNWYITFCPAFYDSKWEISLESILKRIRDQNLDPTVMENYAHPGPQAHTWFHEAMHLSQLVTSPQAVDKAYGALSVYDLARNDNTDAAVYNADSWTFAAEAILIQKEFDLASPPTPNDRRPGGATSIGVATPVDTTILKTEWVETDGNFVPEGAGDRAPNTAFNVDETLWEVIVRGQEDAAPEEPADPPPPAFTPGTCGFHLQQQWQVLPLREDGPATIVIPQLVDGAANKIGYLDKVEIHDGVALDMTSALPWTVNIRPMDSGEDLDGWNHYELYFAYAGKEWSTHDSEGDAHCTVGDWDSPDGGETLTSDMDCVFPC